MTETHSVYTEDKNYEGDSLNVLPNWIFLDGMKGYYVKWNKPGTETQTPHVPVDLWKMSMLIL